MINCAIVTACFGDRSKQLGTLIRSIRSKLGGIKVYVLWDCESHNHSLFMSSCFGNIEYIHTPLQWEGHPRAGVRTSNLEKVLFGMQAKEEYICLIDDDMEVVSPYFIEGFEIAKIFGAALPINPRVYVKHILNSIDVDEKLRKEVKDLVPNHMTACNFSPFFIRTKDYRVQDFLRCLISYLRQPIRGTLAITLASIQTHFSPCYLPEQWCVCGDYAEHLMDYKIQLKGETIPIDPICLHLGHKKVREVFDR